MPLFPANSLLTPANHGAGMQSRTYAGVAAPFHLSTREAVLLSFVEASPDACSKLALLSHKQWKGLLEWLDTSGLALYFLARLEETGQSEIMPREILSRLKQNRFDNTERNAELVAESAAIHHEFQRAGLPYATLKGFSLGTLSVPDFNLRSQLDLDFLIAEESAHAARELLEARGYQLKAISGRSWEFKAEAGGRASLLDLYKPGMGHSVELHLERPEDVDSSGSSHLSRTQQRRVHGMWIPVLCPADLFLGQGLHLYKHVASEFMRTAHLLEFYRHVYGRFDDQQFWIHLQQITVNEPSKRLRLGVVLSLIAQVLRVAIPEALASWTIADLPQDAVLWVGRFGSRTVYGSHPGTKLYLLLQDALAPAGVTSKRSLRQSLVPSGLPQRITTATHGESMRERCARQRRQLQFFIFRLRFHVVEGLRFLYESYAWKRLRRGTAL
jgi:hypothetical protein